MILCFVFLVYWLLGGSIRRLALRRWRDEISGSFARPAVAFVYASLAVLSSLCVAGGLLGILMAQGMSIEVLGMGAWFAYGAMLCAERLRYWPFRTLPVTM